MHRLKPVAPDVPGDAQHLAPATPFGAEAGPNGHPSGALSALACPHSGVACPALARLFAERGRGTGDSEGALGWAQRIRPCVSCRVAFDAQAEALRGLRLGQREREVLLGAGAGGTFTVTASGMSRAMSAARRRAAQTLVRTGLVTPADDIDDVVPAAAARKAAGQARAAVRLTPLGTYVLAAFGRYITAKKPVRWTRPLAHVTRPGRDPDGLVDEAAQMAQMALRETLGDLKRVLIAAVARPVRDPAALDALTRHLEHKAQGLRDLLESAS